MARPSTTTAALAAALILLFPAAAIANAGTPLMWAPVWHLAFGNLIIAAGEGLALSWMFGTGKLRAIGIMLLANYASSLVGVLLLPYLGEFTKAQLGPGPFLYSLPAYLGILAAVTFVLSIFAEWPFCLWLAWRRRHVAWKSLGATAAVHLVSYFVLVLYYLDASAYTLYTDVDVSEEFVSGLEPAAEIVFVSSEGGDLHRIRLDGSGETKLQDLDRTCDALFAELNPKSSVYRLHGMSGDGTLDLDVSFSAADHEVAAMEPRVHWGLEDPWDLRPEGDREWEIVVGVWAWRGLIARKTDEWLRVALDVPTVSWPARHPTILPGDLVVYQLGEEIVVLDLERRKLGFLAAGRCPLVVLPRGDAEL